uniref:hypothetical protein n=1 Tax=Mesorhizobium sp. M2D.F.Ca.ET.225.01.1.1 TaxID=2563942 RepID=UPI001AEECCEA
AVVAVMTLDGARDHDGVRAVMTMPGAAAVIIKSDRAVSAMMETLAFVIDDEGGAVMIVPVVRPDDDIGLGRGSNRRRGDAKRQGCKNHCFHCAIPDF